MCQSLSIYFEVSIKNTHTSLLHNSLDPSLISCSVIKYSISNHTKLACQWIEFDHVFADFRIVREWKSRETKRSPMLCCVFIYLFVRSFSSESFSYSRSRSLHLPSAHKEISRSRLSIFFFYYKTQLEESNELFLVVVSNTSQCLWKISRKNSRRSNPNRRSKYHTTWISIECQSI